MNRVPINFLNWIEENRGSLQPPVCNKQIFEESGMIVMVVGGPNSRLDYHDDPGEELFYQIQGDMLLKTVQDGRRVDIPIREGEMFLLPENVPHSPQRFENTVGLVVERPRTAEEKDGFLWFCQQCDHKLYEEYVQLTDIETQLPPIFEHFENSLERRTCDNCGHVQPIEQKSNDS